MAYAVEVQRRSGDCVAFANFFRDLANHLQSCCAVMHVHADDFRAPPRPRSSQATQADFGPLIDMAGHAEHLPTTLCAELAASFWHAAQNVQTAGLLCSISAFGALAQLLSASRHDEKDEVWLPAAMALRHLACHRDAKQLFVSAGAFDFIADKLQASSTSNNLRLELSKACRELLACFAGQLSEQTAQKLEHTLKDMTPSHV